MNHHVLLKFNYTQRTDEGKFTTIDEHKKLIETLGFCWWGSMSALSQDKVESLKIQMREKVDTFAFLYAMKVPSQVHEDRYLWFIARLADISLGRPASVEGIPHYYRDLDLASYFKITDISPIAFRTGETPKVPGQAAMRHVTFKSSPSPINLRSLSDPDKPLCTSKSGEGEPEGNLEVPSKPSTSVEPSRESSEDDGEQDYKQRLIDLQDEVINLHQQVSELRSYRDYYNKILNTDYLFSSEKFLETWVQENVHRIFPEVDILDRQPHAKWPDGKFGRLDLLGMNKETKGLVIIEIKTRKRAAKSGYDQYLRYTSWTKRNFQKLANEYHSRGLSDAGHIEFTIITDYVDDEMKAICKDHGITLVHLFGGLGFERVA